MNCKKCGAPLPENAVFCEKCGQKVEPVAAAVPPQGAASNPNPTPNPAPNPNPAMGAQAPNGAPIPPTGAGFAVPPVGAADGAENKNKKVGMIAAIVAAVIVVVLLASLLFSRSPKDCIKDFYKAEQKASASQMLNLVPKKYQKYLMDEYDLSKKELKEAVKDYLDDNLDSWEDDYGDGIKIKVEFKDKDKVSKGDIKDMNETFDDEDIKLKVKKGYEYEIKVKIKGDDDDDSSKTTSYAVKIGGKWYSSDAIATVTYAAAYAS